MNSKALRRLASDRGDLYSNTLPPNYLFPPNDTSQDELTELDILLAGPMHTPFAAGVWKLHLRIPVEYPQQPPTAHFRTPLFHPNVDPQTGGVCVETLKRDWESKLTLRDVLVTIGCLLIQPNPDSALNAEAGGLIQESYDAYARRAQLMTSIHATIPMDLRESVREAQTRGDEPNEDRQEEHIDRKDFAEESTSRPKAPLRRRRTVADRRAFMATRRSDGSPTGAPARRRQQNISNDTFVQQPSSDDVFTLSPPQPPRHYSKASFSDEEMDDADQENDESRSPIKSQPPRVATPRRPSGAAVPLGELSLDDDDDDHGDDDSEESEEMEPEYPPSPRKSPIKKSIFGRSRVLFETPDLVRPESSRDAQQRYQNVTPPNAAEKTLGQDSPFFASIHASPSPQKKRQDSPAPQNAVRQGRDLFGRNVEVRHGRIVKVDGPLSPHAQRQEKQRVEKMYDVLWELCGGDIKRWNRCDFDGQPIDMVAARW